MKLQTVLLAFFIFLFSCSNIVYNTYYEGGHDPLFNIKKAKTIGFTPFYWTKSARAAGCDELIEKQMFVYVRNELQKRGFKVVYIPPEFLEEGSDESRTEIYIKENYKDMPDLTLTVQYWQGLGNTVQVPGQSYGSLNWGKYGGRGYYGETQGYEVQTYFLLLSFTLWNDAPKYMNKVWEGTIKKGSPKLDLLEQAPSMTSEIFNRKFDR